MIGDLERALFDLESDGYEDSALADLLWEEIKKKREENT